MIKMNESKSVKLSSEEIRSLYFGVDDERRAGINDAKDLQKSLDRQYDINSSVRTSNNTINFSNHDIEYLQYYNDLIINYPNSPKVKYMDPDFKSAIQKIFG